jgi:shikimate kinase
MDTILKRTSSDGDRRPLLNQQKNMSSIQSLIRFRKSFYEHSADIEVDTSKVSPESVVSEIIERLKEYVDFN